MFCIATPLRPQLTNCSYCSCPVLHCHITRAFGAQGPTASGLLDGRWRLLFTTRPGSASPIQKTFVGVDAFTVYQEVLDSAGQGRVNNIVDFGPKVGVLKAGQPAAIQFCHQLLSNA